MKLDREQYLAVHTDKDNVIVVASAGSGKTRVLTSRVEKLIMDGTNPSEIVCITFTNMAASEMQRRLAHLPGIEDAFIGTIHSFANRVLRASGKRYQIRTSELERALTSDILSSKRALNPRMPLTLEKYQEFMDAEDMYNEGELSVEELKNTLTSSEIDDLRYLRREVNRVCQVRTILSFDQLLVETRKYFEGTDKKLNYLLVDEFQDVGRNEYNFLKGLDARSNFYVGDPRQAIYGFKGGDVRIFLRLMEDPDYTTYELVNNYRNGAKIIDKSSVVASQMKLQVSQVQSVRDEDGEVIMSSKTLLNTYLEYIRTNGNYGDWFILTWSNQDLYDIHGKLQMMGVPTTIFKRAGLDQTSVETALTSNTVKLMTIHASKGLESPNVLMYGNFPLELPSYREVRVDDRKVMYVGMTRAIDKLIVLS